MTHLNNALRPAAQLSCGMPANLTAKQRMDRLRNALREQRNPTDKPLLGKLDRCAVDLNARYRCRSPACIRCRFINIRRQQRGSFELLGHFPNENLAFVTVVVGATIDINGVSSLIKKSRQDTINRFAAARAADDRWDGTYLRAWHEIDAAGIEHMPLLPPQRLKLVPSLTPMGADTTAAMWIPTWHGIMWLNGLSVREVTNQLGRQWNLEHQVDVEPFDPKKPVTANLAKLTSYANKFHCSISLDGKRTEAWPIHWQTEFFGWLDNAQRNPFESLRMTINQRYPKEAVEVCDAVRALSPMPFIHSSNGVPMHYNTGAWA